MSILYSGMVRGTDKEKIAIKNSLLLTVLRRREHATYLRATGRINRVSQGAKESILGINTVSLNLSHLCKYRPNFFLKYFEGIWRYIHLPLNASGYIS